MTDLAQRVRGAARPFTVAAVQWAPNDDIERNRRAAAEWIDRAALRGARLVVLPEYSQWCAKNLGPGAREAAEPIDGPFVRMLQERAGLHDVVVVAGFIERTDVGVVNTVVAVDGTRVLSAYRKVHLYDAFGSRESDWMTPGDPSQVAVFEAFGVRIGLQTCYDLRFPESTRRLVDEGAEVVCVPAEWVPGPQKERHWEVLVTARAIESTVHVIAAGQSPPLGIGCSRVVDAMGVSLAALGSQDGLAIATVDPATTVTTRERNPALANRRYRVAVTGAR